MKFILYISIYYLMLSCTNYKYAVLDKSIIPVAEAIGTGEVLKLSDYAKSIEYIKLETNDTLLMGRIGNVSFENNKFIIQDLQNRVCFLFDEKGILLTQIGKIGLGPKEYNSVRHFNVLPKQNLLFLDTSPQRFYLYDLEGNYLRQVDYPDYPETYRPWQTIALDSTNYFSDIVSPENLYYRGLFFNQDGKIDDQNLFPNYMDVEKIRKGSYGGSEGAFIWPYADVYRYHRILNDTIFSIDKNKTIKMEFIFDYGQYRAPNEWLLNAGNKDWETSKYVTLYSDKIRESSKYLFLNFHCGINAPEKYEYSYRDPNGRLIKYPVMNVYGLFEKSTGELTLLNQPEMKKIGFKNDIDGGPVFWPTYVSTDDKMINSITAKDFLDLYENLPNPSPTLKIIAENLSPEDNPVLMIVTLK